ncbi:MAG: hypothetical protein ACOC6Q_00410 [Patescibacteria group bacterium]
MFGLISKLFQGRQEKKGGKGKEAWKETIDRHLEEEWRKEEEARKRRAAVARRKAKRQKERLLAEHQEKFRCPCCGKPSPWPRKKVREVEGEHSSWYEKTSMDDWDKPHKDWKKCSICGRWICPDCIYKSYCRICADAIAKGESAKQRRKRLKKEREERQRRREEAAREEEMQQLRELWQRLEIDKLVEMVANSMWPNEPDLKIRGPKEEFRTFVHEFPCRISEIEGSLEGLFNLREGYCKPRQAKKRVIYLRFELKPDELVIFEPNKKTLYYPSDSFFNQGYGWEGCLCRLQIREDMKPEDVLSQAESMLVEHWSWESGADDGKTLAERTQSIKEFRKHLESYSEALHEYIEATS